jgi:hypothetical protein
MIWLTWRQHRMEALIIATVVGVFAAFLIVTGLNMYHVAQQLDLSNCTARPDCEALREAFRHQFDTFFNAVGWLNLSPALLGMLVAVPLITNELEQGTYRLIWTQSVTRLRWLVVKLLLVFGVSLLVAALFMGLLTWWYGPYDLVNGNFTPPAFDFQGPVLISSMLFGLALGLAAGALLRRTVLAIAITLALFLAIKLPIEYILRPHYLPPIVRTWPINAPYPPGITTDDWIVEEGWLDAKGNKVTSGPDCPLSTGFQQCLEDHGYRDNYQAHQPGDRFWLFQWIETSIYLVISVLLLGLTIWWISYRLS